MKNMDSTTVYLGNNKIMKYHFNLKNALDAFNLNQLLQHIESTRSSTDTSELPPIHIEVLNYDYYSADRPIYPKLQNILDYGRKWNVSMLLISVEDEINRKLAELLFGKNNVTAKQEPLLIYAINII